MTVGASRPLRSCSSFLRRRQPAPCSIARHSRASANPAYCSSFPRKRESSSFFVFVLFGVAEPELPLLLRRSPCSSFLRRQESSSFFRSCVLGQELPLLLRRSGLLLFACPKRSNQEKGHPGRSRPPHSPCAAGSRAHSGACRTYVRIHSARRVHRARAPSRGLILHALAAPGGDPRAARIVRAEASATAKTEQERISLEAVAAASARRSAPLYPRGPVSRGPWAEESPKDRVQDAREFATCTRTYIEQTP